MHFTAQIKVVEFGWLS